MLTSIITLNLQRRLKCSALHWRKKCLEDSSKKWEAKCCDTKSAGTIKEIEIANLIAQKNEVMKELKSCNTNSSVIQLDKASLKA